MNVDETIKEDSLLRNDGLLSNVETNLLFVSRIINSKTKKKLCYSFLVFILMMNNQQQIKMPLIALQRERERAGTEKGLRLIFFFH